MDVNIKKISKQSQLRAKPNVSNFYTTKPLFKFYNSAPNKPSTAIEVAASPVSSIATGTHLGPMNLFNVMKQGPILHKEKDICNNRGLFRYCDELGYIVIDHRNPVWLAIKKQAPSVLTGNTIALVLYKSLCVEEKETS